MIENLEQLEKREIMNLLNSALIPMDWVGYKYIVTAVPIVIDSIYYNERIILGELYKIVAKKHKTTPKKVECAIRYIHENTRISKVLNAGKLSNKSLLYEISKKIMKQLQLE